MFESVLQELKRLENMSVTVPLATDDEGFLPRECPKELCLFQFKVHGDDWSTIQDSSQVYCPKCGHSDLSTHWHTTQQLEHAKSEALKHLSGKIGNAFRRDARRFNQRQSRNNFISMKMKVSGMKERSFIIPAAAAKAVELRTICTSCRKRFAVIGVAYFCPYCGDDCVTYTFESSMQKNLAKLDNLSLIEQALRESNPHGAALTKQSLIESCIQDCVTAFQRLNERLFQRRSNANPPHNAFQRLTDGSKLWRQLIGEGFEDWLSPPKLERLSIFFQQRHLLSHQDGIVDDTYIKKTGDQSYAIGQRLIITESVVRDMTTLTLELGKKILEKAS